MGKMILDDLRKRLERLDEDADLMIDNNDRYQMVIVGGSASILLGKLTRAIRSMWRGGGHAPTLRSACDVHCHY